MERMGYLPIILRTEQAVEVKAKSAHAKSEM
jgi:hypothetical protein